MHWLPTVIAACVAMTSQPIPAPCGCPPHRQFPAGVVDSDRHVAYVANADNGVSAVRLESGAILWTSAAATLPVGIDGTRVVAFRRAEDPREAHVVLLDERTGAVLLTSKAFRSTRDVTGDRMSSATAFSTESEGGSLTLRWREVAPSSAGQERDGGQTLSGGGVTVMADGAVRELPDQEGTRDLATVSGTAYQRGAAFTSGTWGTGACARTLFLDDRHELLGMVLATGSQRSRDGGRELIKAPSLSATVTMDGCSIFIEHQSPAGLTWDIFASATGDRLGSIPRDPSAAQPTTVGDSAFYLVGGATPVLRAVSLTTGARRWELPVRRRSGKP